MRKKLSYLVLAGLIVSCKPEADLPEITSGRADFSKTAYLGDGFMAGYQDGALSAKGQQKSIAAQLNKVFQMAGGGELVQAEMPGNAGIGISLKPWENGIYAMRSAMGYNTDCKGVTSLGPVKTNHTPMSSQPYIDPVSVPGLNDLSFPFCSTADWFSTDLDVRNLFFNRVKTSLAVNRPIDRLIQYQPSFVVMWAGLEDMLQYARSGGVDGGALSAAELGAYLDSIISPLSSKGVLATIPDFRSFPYFTLVKWNNAELTQSKADSLNDIYQISGFPHIQFQEGKNPFVIGDASSPGGFRQMKEGEYITLSVPLDSMKCQFYGILFSAINDRYVLDSSEVAFLDNLIAGYNSVIRQKAQQYDFALADLNAFFKKLEEGWWWNGVEYTDEFVSGGFFGLDGIHPHEKGYSFLANEFIKSINDHYGSTLPLIHCKECNGVLFP